MKLGKKQELFARMLGQLLHHVATLPGYEVRIGEGHRPPAQIKRMVKLGKGSATSLHGLKLAQDLHLTIKGVYQTSTKAHAPLGKFWKSIGGRWGGDFVKKKDGNHYSLMHNGRR